MAIGTTNVGFEEQLWQAADKLRSNMDAAEYKHVVLGLIFLKYVSDSFKEKYEQLLSEGYGDEEDRDEYIQRGVLRAESFMKRTHQGSNSQKIQKLKASDNHYF